MLSFQDQAIAAAAGFQRLDALPNTAFRAIPASGTASYAGDAALSVVDAGYQEYLLLGRSAMQVDFANTTVSGILSEFHGGAAPAGQVFPTENVDFAGSIVLTGGGIGIFRPNDFDGTFAGTLTGAGHVIALNGPYLGDFKGTPIKGIVASNVTNSGSADQATVDGIPAAIVDLQVWAD